MRYPEYPYDEYKDAVKGSLILFLIKKNETPEEVEECLKTFHYSKGGWARVKVKGKRYYYNGRWIRA